MRFLITLLVVVAFGCSDSKVAHTPSQFETTDQTVIVTGCEDLKKEVQQWNEKHPDQQPKIADC